MKTVSIHDAKTNLSKYIKAVKNGEDIYIGSRGVPEVKLVAETPPIPKRKLGIGKDKGWASLDYNKLTDPKWQKIVDDMYDRPL